MYKDSPLISVIVPVYNVASYLERCIKSIVAQDYTNIEIVLIDDGSTDDSGLICDKWAKIDSKINVFHQQNKGVNIARKTGVKQAKGIWITFVDSDDFIPKESISILSSKCASGIDIILGYVEVLNVKSPRMDSFHPLLESRSGLDYCKDLLIRRAFVGPFAKLFRKSLFDDFAFDIPRFYYCGEDFVMNIRLAQLCNKVVYIPDVVYYYDMRNGSASAESPFLKTPGYLQLKWRLFFSSIRKGNFMKLFFPILKHCLLSTRGVLHLKLKRAFAKK